jgi:hypothetical protein
MAKTDRIPRGTIPESWAWIDCGINTAPSLKNRAQTEQALAFNRAKGLPDERVHMKVNVRSEVYLVETAVWEAAGMEEFGGCLCIGCLERRVGRRLTPKDFIRNHPLNRFPGTPRLLNRRDGAPSRSAT